MVIESIISGKRNLFWFVFHAFLGLISTVMPFALIFWFYLILLTNFNNALTQLRQRRAFMYISLLAYLTSFEMLGRMTKASPFIPLELSKYIIPLFSIIGIMYSNKKSNRKWLFLGGLITISLLFDLSNVRNFSDIVNNYFGILAIFLGLHFLSQQSLERNSIYLLLKLVLSALLPSLIFCLIKTPDFEEITFKLNANFETSGGAATNQVSTVFGVGLFLSFYFWHKKINYSGFRFLDILIGITFLAQGFLTFSRGGIIVSIVCILILMLRNINNFNVRNIFLTFIGLASVFIVFTLIDNLTGGKLLLRYQGETEGTYEYGAEKTLKKMTSGRSLIFEEDIKLWFNHPILGVGVGASRPLRGGSEGQLISSHVEFSRLLAEHGLMGLIFFMSILNLGFKLWLNSKTESWRLVLFLIYLIAILTSFHSAMRTFVTPLLMSLSSIGMYNSKNDRSNGNVIIHRGN